ncbi:hypothetical protein Y032_0252g210 [Ancylostoma ceylanicum]|uniref:Uncharacterized protein n=1 Tax=Ancylostoma ceylanicum TaxID=53326 RepID=A0A016SCK0_9BILA|nr:hypothetical protein Y032_0252g210 [Ancylostoma ceylanicum]
MFQISNTFWGQWQGDKYQGSQKLANFGEDGKGMQVFKGLPLCIIVKRKPWPITEGPYFSSAFILSSMTGSQPNPTLPLSSTSNTCAKNRFIFAF